ncbi:MAG: FRG domain-containing protein [Planctomycetes bacterium]|nr:FRG domain-containing protein [Planctomycetota bacterium]
MRSLEEIRRILEPRLRCFGRPRCLFRGQADAEWSLRPSVARLVHDQVWTIADVIEAEKLAIELFVPAAGPHVNELERRPLGIVEQWSVMQHYGVPTRTLDWSDDPYRALYFAVEDHPDRDGALWFVHAHSVQDWMRRRFGSKNAPNPCGPVYYWLPGAPEQLFFGDVKLGSPRKDAQQGMFSWSRRITSDHAVVIASALCESPARENVFRKVIIPATMKPELLEALADIGITRATMWPDPDSELAKVAARVKADLLARGPVTPAAAR